jgi:hypothetical protein
MSTKSDVSETPAPNLVTVRATCTINDSGVSRKPGSVFDVTPKDADMLMKAGAVTLATDTLSVPIEEVLPDGLDAAIWMADPRLKVNGSPPSCFVKRSEYAALVANR